MEQGANRVFINPYFNRGQRNVPPNKSMHINPNFSQNMSTTQVNTLNSTRIYVNPNFIRSNSTGSNNYVESTLTLRSNNLLPPVSQVQNTQINCRPVLPQPIASTSKSRYSLVRCNKDKKIKENQPLDKVTTTYKVSKYKSVPMQHLKNDLHKDQIVLKTPLKVITKQVSLQSPKTLKVKVSEGANVFASRFKIIKQKSVKIGTKITANRKLPSSSINRVVRANVKAKLKVNRTHFKKNNIPCPLFKKFGKCLRNIQGKCEFLHDRKHVSICRKFLKGICHDKECLLSHDVGKEKMPTCHFYLKGICTKEDCPYLHVKLSENTKICVDFLQGYCEKGDECLNRHINICPEVAAKGICSKKQCPYPHKSNKKLVKPSKIKVKTKVLNRTCKADLKQRRCSEAVEIKQINVPETNSRYYKEVGDSGTCEVIKPMRCKLGTLPSFIQL